jgi:hypothetical protein
MAGTAEGWGSWPPVDVPSSAEALTIRKTPYFILKQRLDALQQEEYRCNFYKSLFWDWLGAHYGVTDPVNIQ